MASQIATTSTHLKDAGGQTNLTLPFR